MKLTDATATSRMALDGEMWSELDMRDGMCPLRYSKQEVTE